LSIALENLTINLGFQEIQQRAQKKEGTKKAPGLLQGLAVIDYHSPPFILAKFELPRILLLHQM